MKNAIRAAVFACVSLVALTLSGTAMAAYASPKLTIKNPSERLGGGGPLTIRAEQVKEDDATFRLVIYVPQGYVTSLVPAAGTTIGTVTAQAQANAISPDAILELTGNIRADTFDAARYPQGQACAGAATTIAAVYRLELMAAGQTLVVPTYVSPITTGSLAQAFSAQLVTCLPSPYIPPAMGGAAFGAKLINAELTFPSLFTNPSTAGDYRWSALWTPYTVGTAAPNAAATVETQSVDRLAAQLTLNVAVRRGRRVTLSGRLTENAIGVGGANVRLLVGRTARAVRSVGTVRTNARGNYARTVRVRARGTYFARAQVTVPTRNTNCVQRFTPVPCISATLSGFTLFNNRVLRFRVR